MSKKIRKVESAASFLELRLAQLKDDFPELFSDGVFDYAMLDMVLGKGEKELKEPFLMSWDGRYSAKKILSVPPSGTLIPESCEYQEESSLVFIEGDSLEVMKTLQKSYYGKVKMVYLDPPYNTGSDYIYVDDEKDPLSGYLTTLKNNGFSGQSRSGKLHSRWMTMMYPRLVMARNFLAQDGVVFVSIDDHEVHHLRVIMDEVFGEENFVCTFSWEKRYSPPPDTKDVGYVHENILCYRRSDQFVAQLLPMTEEQSSRYKNPDNDPRGPWKAADYTCRYTAEERPNLYYEIENKNTGKKVLPKKTRVWACSLSEHEKNVEEERLWWGVNGDNDVPAKKKYLFEIRQGAMPKTLLKHDEVGHTDEATKELRKWIPGLKVTPKPKRLMKHLLHIAGIENEDLVLECFSRAGVLAESVVDIRKESGDPIRLLSIQLPEPVPNTPGMSFSDVVKERTRRVLEGHGLNESLYRVFKLGESNFKGLKLTSDMGEDLLSSSLEGVRSQISEETSDENILTEIMLRLGLDLFTSVETCPKSGVYSFFDGALLICLKRKLDIELVESMASTIPSRIVVLEDAFSGDDVLKVNAVAYVNSLQLDGDTKIDLQVI